ncbi:hypothetical protein AC1031_003850 [Aphanomyces cochlioides]|nr:hypothetical protein AC1031_003850 [Aphanomyces cochlioides]
MLLSCRRSPIHLLPCVRSLSTWKERKALQDLLAVAKVAHAKSPGNFTTLPSKFKVPQEPEYPSSLQGKTLHVAQLRQEYRTKSLPADMKKEFDAISFVWDVNFHKSALRLEALSVFKCLNGHVNVPREFKVPSDNDKWPGDTWGLCLGVALHNIRTGQLNVHPVHEPMYLELGFSWDRAGAKWQHNLEALTRFRQLHGHANVPMRFTVPNTADWPAAMHGLKLGNVVTHWRRYPLPEDRREALDALGFQWRPLDAKWTKTIAALKAYKKIYGHTHVVKRFAVPSNDPQWPKAYWGFKLGYIVSSFRTRMDEMPAEHIEELDELGFIWNPLEDRWDEAVLALRKYHALKGHLRIPTSFCVPRNDPEWPESMWGLHLGSLVTHIRHHADIMSTNQDELLATMVLIDDEDEVDENIET